MTRARQRSRRVCQRINPDAHTYAALKIGRRSLEMGIVDFNGSLLALVEKFQPFPTPRTTLDFIESQLPGLLKTAKLKKKSVSGMAVAMPYELWHWTSEFGAPTDEMEAWRTFDPVAEIGRLVPWKVVVENDATAACRAEVVFGSHFEKQDWIYFYIGTFIGGGVVLNGSVFPGRRGNAGGFGPMRVPEQDGGNRLVDHASLVTLEHQIAAEGGDPFAIYRQPEAWAKFETQVQGWITRAGRNLAHSIVSALSVMDFEAVVIDGSIPVEIKDRVVAEVVGQLENIDLQGVLFPKVEAGRIGHRARTIGAAATIVSSDYLNDQNTLLRA